MVSNPIIYCPHCGGSFLVISDTKLYCLRCRLMFTRKLLEKIAPENILADEDLEEIVDVLASMAPNENQKEVKNIEN